jgi:hypothetical protein
MFRRKEPLIPLYIDFGLTKIGNVSATCESKNYAPPVEWELQGHARDIFSLGIVLFEVPL